nr:CHAP domain-containing protein [uncultured Olsenella sp.]
MSSPTDVLRIAAAEIGYSRWDDPEPGTKYGRWYAGLVGEAYFGTSGVPYCAMFVTWVLARAGVSVPGFPSAYCPDIRNAGIRAGIEVPKRDARPGDIVLFDWDGGLVDHVGLVESNMGGHLQTIEGNTSSGSGGSQGNGGVVARRTRSWAVVSTVLRPRYEDDKSETSAPSGAESEDDVTEEQMDRIADKVAARILPHIPPTGVMDVNGSGVLAYLGPDFKLHDLAHPDDVASLDRIAPAGSVPRVDGGSPEAPWASRIYQTTTAGAPVALVPYIDGMPARSKAADDAQE